MPKTALVAPRIMRLKIGGRAVRPIPVADMQDASEKFRALVERLDIGASRLSDGLIFEGGTLIGRVSYNGKVWRGNRGYPHDELAYDPSERGER